MPGRVFLAKRRPHAKVQTKGLWKGSVEAGVWRGGEASNRRWATARGKGSHPRTPLLGRTKKCHSRLAKQGHLSKEAREKVCPQM